MNSENFKSIKYCLNCSTAYSQAVDSSSKALFKNETQSPFDSDATGAATYVIVVIVWYFLGVIGFVTWQMREKNTEQDYTNELLPQGLENQVKTKLILGNQRAF
jgi:hypothetical protein